MRLQLPELLCASFLSSPPSPYNNQSRFAILYLFLYDMDVPSVCSLCQAGAVTEPSPVAKMFPNRDTVELTDPCKPAEP